MSDITLVGAETTTAATKKQSTRMLKVVCAEDSGYVVRMTRKWLTEVGAPTCACHGVVMIEATAVV